jgi:hypothetical protein
VVGIAFSPKLGTVYYQPLATNRLFSVPSSALRAGPVPFDEQLPVTLIGRKSSQGLALATNPRDDSILFSPFTETAIASWQPQTNQQRYEPRYFRSKLVYCDVSISRYRNEKKNLIFRCHLEYLQIQWRTICQNPILIFMTNFLTNLALIVMI